MSNDFIFGSISKKTHFSAFWRLHPHQSILDPATVETGHKTVKVSLKEFYHVSWCFMWSFLSFDWISPSTTSYLFLLLHFQSVAHPWVGIAEDDIPANTSQDSSSHGVMESKSLHHGGHIGLHDLHHDHLISTKVAVLSTQNNMIIRHLLVSCLLNHTVPSLLQGGFVCCQINLRVVSLSGEQNRNKNIYRKSKDS